MMDLSAAALLPFSVSTAGSHLPKAAEASSQASYDKLYLPPQALLPDCSRRSFSDFTFVGVWVGAAPVIGRLETILRVLPPPPPAAAAPQPVNSMLVITTIANNAKIRLFILLPPPGKIVFQDFPQSLSTAGWMQRGRQGSSMSVPPPFANFVQLPI